MKYELEVKFPEDRRWRLSYHNHFCLRGLGNLLNFRAAAKEFTTAAQGDAFYRVVAVSGKTRKSIYQPRP